MLSLRKCLLAVALLTLIAPAAVAALAPVPAAVERDDEVVVVQHADGALTLRLWENDAVLGDALVVRDADGAPVDLAHVRVLAGEVVGADGFVRAVVDGERVRGLVVADGRAWELSAGPAGWVAADAWTLPPAPRLAVDVIDEVETVDEDDCLRPVPTVADPMGLALGWSERTFQVAFAADEDFVAAYGVDWATTALDLINRADGIYQADIGLRVQVVDLHAHAAGVYTATTTDGLLLESIAHYEAAHADVARENVHLFTTKETSNAAGQANCIGGAGDARIAYTMGQATVYTGTGPLVGDVHFTSPNTALKILVHEMGHILSAHHHYMDCATSARRGYDGEEVTYPCTLMAPDVGLGNLVFSPTNRLAMRGWADAVDL